MAKYLMKRILYAIFTLWIVVTITFVMMMGVPGNPFAGEKALPQAVLDNLMAFYKLDQPLIMQYFNYLLRVVTLDFGPSMRSQSTDINTYIANGLPVSMQLGLQALLVALVLGVLLGVIASLNHNKVGDYLATVIAIVGVSVPSFVMGRFLIIVFVTNFKVLSFGAFHGFENWSYSILPSIALAALPLATIARLTRSSMLEVINQEYIKTARAKGLKQSAIIIKHALRNAILPIVSALGTITTNLVTGSFVVERIFGIPGLGEAFIKSVESRDYAMIIASTVVYSFILIVITLVIDISYTFIDPRINLVGGAKNG
ncbi:MAG: ABC transporter permease [Clostridiales bacterium]|jgi:ABC-type dipeptide/oligopeptide/nickel transport system permease component|nr:ABC transporter permease [Clostridiales bacterium]